MTEVEKLISISSHALAPNPPLFPELLRFYALGHELYSPCLSSGTSLHPGGLIIESQLMGCSFLQKTYYRTSFVYLCSRSVSFDFMPRRGNPCLWNRQSRIGRGGFWRITVETVWPLASEWQKRHGPLQPGRRLMPTTPFFLGGEYGLVEQNDEKST